MKICVAGLGLIGGSLCMALRRAGYSPDGWNRSPAQVEYALKNGIITAAAAKFEGYDVVFVALPPRATVDFINAHSFGDGAVVADICGVKGYIEKEVYSRPRNFRYVGTHPMAGKEVSSVYNACAELFDGANMVITSCKGTDPAAKDMLVGLARQMGFGRVVECSAEVHDKKISYTSQLAHIVSNAYVRDDEMDCCSGFTGGSFQDMTRIAGVEEGVWAELYTLNRENLSERITNLCANLEKIKRALLSGEDELRAVLKEGRERFAAPAEGNSGGRIEITEFKGRGS